MPVPEDDIVCRFVREQDWNTRDNKPKSGAFKQPCLSVWHVGRLQARNVQVEDLRLKHLEGVGQAHHTAGDYLRLAIEVAECEGTEFQVRVEWRTEDKYVEETWRPWRYAHVQVEALEGPGNFPLEFRRRLAINARKLVPPDKFLNPDNQNLS